MESDLKPRRACTAGRSTTAATGQAIAVMLCTRCSAHLIARTPVLQSHTAQCAIPRHHGLCVDCRFRDGVRCTHRDLDKRRAGLVVDADPSAQVHVNLGGGCGAFLTIYCLSLSS
jgi:hypothetical protein